MTKVVKSIILSTLVANHLYAEINTTAIYNIQDFTNRFYSKVMGRTSDAAGSDYWTNQLSTGDLTAAEVAKGFLNSSEFTGKNVSDNDYVDILYKTFFNREPDAGGKAYWMNELANGASRDAVADGFLGSQEFVKLATEYGIKAFEGASVITPSLTSFVERFYAVLLGRESDAEGMNYWATQLSTGELTAAGLASNFVHSPEFDVDSKSNSEYLDALYAAFFDRAADESGKNYWTVRLAEGMTRDEVLQSFLGSAEFSTLATAYGIKPYEGAPDPAPSTNIAPTAKIAGATRVAAGDVLQITGEESSDVDGEVQYYRWEDITTGQVLGHEAQLTADIIAGTHKIRLTTIDNEGKVGSKDVTVQKEAAEVDNTPPGAPVISEVPDTITTANVTVLVEGEEGAEIFVDGVSTGLFMLANGSHVTLTGLVEGEEKTFSITLQDAAENMSAEELLTVLRENADIPTDVSDVEYTVENNPWGDEITPTGTIDAVDDILEYIEVNGDRVEGPDYEINAQTYEFTGGQVFSGAEMNITIKYVGKPDLEEIRL